jgi:hypothetical protein
MRPWELFCAVKWLELVYHARPRRVWRLLFGGDRFARRQMRWTAVHTGLVWLGEVVEFVLGVRFRGRKRLGEFLGLKEEMVELTVRERDSGSPMAEEPRVMAPSGAADRELIEEAGEVLDVEDRGNR